MAEHTPRVTDNDIDEITVTLDGKEIRGWSYRDDAERRVKMLAAREFCEGWFQASKMLSAVNSHEAPVEALRAMLRHSCVADAHPEDKDPEDHAAESKARAALSAATQE